MREKLNTLSLAALRDIAKDAKIKNITVMRKNDLIEAILATIAEDGGIAETVPAAKKVPGKKEMETKVPEMQVPETKVPEMKVSKMQVPEIQVPEKQVIEKKVVKASVKVDDSEDIRNNVEEIPNTSYSRISVNPGIYGQSNGYTNKTVKTEVKAEVKAEAKAEVKTEVKAEAKTEVKTELRTEPRTETVNENRYERPQLAEGILEILPEGYGFIRCENFLPGDNDVYVSPAQIRKFNLRTGDILSGPKKIKSQTEKFSALYNVDTINGKNPFSLGFRPVFEKLTPIFPNQRIHLEPNSASVAMRIMDLISPIGKGQRGMIVSQPKAGKTTLLKQVARAITKNNPEMHLIILLIDERPEEVTDIRESIEGDNVEVIYSTFDELPDRHKRVSEMVIERAKRLVEQKEDVIILLDSITRLARAYNLTVQASGRTLSGGLDPAALHMPKRFFGAARNMREGGSLTILATALVETGSKMDDVVFEEFKGTGNMELILDRKLSEKRVFPAIDIAKSGTRREDLLMNADELEAVDIMRKALNGMKSDEAVDKILNMFAKTRNNAEFVEMIKKTRVI